MKVECYGGPLDGAWIDWPEDPNILPPLTEGFFMRRIGADGAVEMYKAVQRPDRMIWVRITPQTPTGGPPFYAF